MTDCPRFLDIDIFNFQLFYGRTQPHHPDFFFFGHFFVVAGLYHRFLSYAQVVRTLKDKYLEDPDKVKAAQIANLRKRLYMTRAMQLLGISSLFLCVVTMFLIYVGLQLPAVYVFGLAILLLIASLGVSVFEIQISVKALELHLSDMEIDREHRN
jgi:hypothetical protein